MGSSFHFVDFDSLQTTIILALEIEAIFRQKEPRPVNVTSSFIFISFLGERQGSSQVPLASHQTGV